MDTFIKLDHYTCYESMLLDWTHSIKKRAKKRKNQQVKKVPKTMFQSLLKSSSKINTDNTR